MSDGLDALLAEQRAYYDARAPEYEKGAALDPAGGEALRAALDDFAPAGDVLELACGPGVWTPRLLRHADRLTAVDASPRMLARAAERVRGREERVRFVQADLFAWRTDRRYDVVFFGFWLSHVPLERFDGFWATVGDALRPGGRVLFFDDAHRTSDELIEGEASSTIARRLSDGTRFRAVKVAWDAPSLEARIRRLGWDVAVHQTAGAYFWGAGTHH